MTNSIRPTPDITHARWCGPPEEIGTSGLRRPESIHGLGALQPAYRLDLDTEHRRLFDEYVNIESAEDAALWCRSNGFPGLVAVAGENCQKSESAARILDSAKVVRRLLKLHRALLLDLDDPVGHKRADDRVAEFLVEERVVRNVTVRMFDSAYFSNGDHLVETPVISMTFSRSQWLRARRKCLIELAEFSLKEVTKIMLTGVQPDPEWHDLNGRRSLRPDFCARCPWHAVVLELLRKFGKIVSIPKDCPNPDCTNTLEQKNSHARSCGIDKCRKYVQRNCLNCGKSKVNKTKVNNCRCRGR